MDRKVMFKVFNRITGEDITNAYEYYLRPDGTLWYDEHILCEDIQDFVYGKSAILWEVHVNPYTSSEGNGDSTNEELIEFLRENLTVEIERDYGFYTYDSYDVKLKLGDEVISTSSTPIYEAKS